MRGVEGFKTPGDPAVGAAQGHLRLFIGGGVTKCGAGHKCDLGEHERLSSAACGHGQSEERMDWNSGMAMCGPRSYVWQNRLNWGGLVERAGT